MNAQQPVNVRIDVDTDGHLTVTVDDHAWVPPGPGGVAPEVGLGRTDVPWVLDRLLGEHGRPLHVVLLDGGRTFTDVVLPERLKRGDPSYSTAPPGFAPDRHRPPIASHRHAHPVDGRASSTPSGPKRAGGSGWFEAGGYNAGEQVAVAVIVTRVAADESGRICLILPAALRPLIGDAVAIGEESREISINQASQRFPGREAVTAALNGTAPGSDDLNAGFRHRAGPDLGM
ncbi:hypothetical protein L1785_22295 [Antribacter sp. KLBMP9083]|uniref:Uncharacterized protein n=1 Tax=Antribacter soli TaxID=2910976 RepID=A0AA41QJ61_9MICO|nr:hypothetical protein [Antribacter soli]MCF4123695.1 hypothetical protein [Antribacter soli]